MNDEPRARVSGRRLVAGVAWNLLGRGLPLVLALALTPILVRQLGIDRWGIFTLALALVGVLGMLDLGVGPALTRALSARIGAGEREGEAVLVASAIAVLGGCSVIGAVIGWFAVVPLVERVLNVPASLHDETIAAMRALVAAAPLVVVNAALWGVLAAHQKFRAANLVTMPVSIFYYLGPVLVLSVWNSLLGAMLALVACRLVNTLSYLVLVRPLVPGLSFAGVRLRHALPLMRIGGWMTFASALSQALNYADRFLVGALLTMAAVAFYATPLDLVMRFWIFPVAVAQALLPALASSVKTLSVETVALLRRGVLLIGAIVLPASLLLALFAHPLLQLWLGATFADGSATVTRILAVGVLFSCIAFAPGSLVEAVGRPELLAGFTLAQGLLFVPLSALLLTVMGIEGAAIAWALRSAVDCAGRLFLAAHVFPAAAASVRRLSLPVAVGGAGLLGAALLPPQLALAAAALTVLGCVPLAWHALAEEERAVLRAPHRLLRRPGG